MGRRILVQIFACLMLPAVALGQYTASYSNPVMDLTVNIKNGLNAWKSMSGGVCVQGALAVSTDGNAWCVGSPSHYVFKMTEGTTTWVQQTAMGTSVLALAVQSDNNIFSLQSTSYCNSFGLTGFLGLFHWTGSAWTQPDSAACFFNMSIGQDAVLAGTGWDSGNHYKALFYSTDNGSSWTYWSGNWSYVNMWMSAIGCAISGNTVYEVSQGNPAFSLGSPSTSQLLGCVSLPVDGDAHFVWDSAGHIFYEDDGTWHQIAGSATQISGVTKGTIDAINSAGQAFHLNMYAGSMTQTITGNYANWSGMNPATHPNHTVTSHINFPHGVNPNSSHVQVSPYNANFNVSSWDANYFCNPFDEEHDPECTPIDNGSEDCAQGGFIGDPSPSPPSRSISHWYFARDYLFKSWTDTPTYTAGDQHWNIQVHIPVGSNCMGGIATCRLADVIVPNYVWDFRELVRSKTLPVAQGVAATLPSTGPWMLKSAYLLLDTPAGIAGSCVKIEVTHHEGDVCD